jgi:glycosyltransferase involved in cell wall biosynthesis
VFCTTIIPTINRPTLERAVESVLNQTFTADEFEIIVVNDSGQPLSEADWQKSEQVQVINTNQHERSVARNTGAAVAKGRYLHFLDDDDWLFPNAFYEFWEHSKTSQAAWMYGSSQLVDRNGHELIQLHHGISGNCFIHAMSGEWIPLQSSLIDSKVFHELGGFNSQITGPEDIDLFRRISLRSDITEIKFTVACIEMGDKGSTTNYSQHPEFSRMARESILDMKGVFSRLFLGANSNFWLGKILRIYLTSGVWNLKHRRFFTALSRFCYCYLATFMAGVKLVTKDYWSAVLRSYQSQTFERGIQQSGQDARQKK